MLGAVLTIPFFMLSILIVGHKRAAVLAVLAVLLIVMLSGLTGLPNTAYIPYNPTRPHARVLQTPIAPYVTPNRPSSTSLTSEAAWHPAISTPRAATS